MKDLRIIILKFAHETRVDLINAELSEGAAIADFMHKCFTASNPAKLPLIEAVTAIVPAERVSELLKATLWSAPIAPKRSHPIPIAGLHNAMRAYWAKAISGALPQIVEEAQHELRKFFSHYETEITFTDGRPEWMKTPDQIWKGE